MAADPLSRVFAALADPTRRDMVARLAVGDATVGELAAPYDVTVLTYTTDGNALSEFATTTPAAAAPATTPPVAPTRLAPVRGGAGGLPITGPGPIALASIGFLLVGLGLTALLVRRS